MLKYICLFKNWEASIILVDCYVKNKKIKLLQAEDTDLTAHQCCSAVSILFICISDSDPAPGLLLLYFLSNKLNVPM